MCKQALGAGAHVHRLRAQPQRVDTDHRNTSRSHSAQSAAAETGQVTLTPSAPRLNSRWIASAAKAETTVGAEADGGENSLYVTPNPWDSDYTTYGSSAGTAAAVAAGVIPMAHATDGKGPDRECGRRLGKTCLC